MYPASAFLKTDTIHYAGSGRPITGQSGYPT